MTQYHEQSQAVLSRLFALNLTPDRLVKIGAFVVSYGLFETSLERALWVLKEENVSGKRPFTEPLSSADWFKKFGEGNPALSPKCNAVLKASSEAAIDLADYRNSLVHGQLVAIGGAPWFIRNPAWDGEKRKKSPGDAHTEEPMLDLAIAAASTLFAVSRNAAKALQDREAHHAIEALEKDVHHAKSYANELRYAAVLWNSEKY
ncbi:hypothetical protein M4R22_11030 [Acidovorax sp. GBBC 3334]|uniref:hypothetical protein n=1 Tax=Acidovorax sp. GBBC 3334 TaxID=2940496 RepID=UPI002302A057|nr:hypothetical protein [Acidovorax sp. GBBC 3334]MDA8455294.1 hypothetical protein [Acidovorax sp. GBBC 3334]